MDRGRVDQRHRRGFQQTNLHRLGGVEVFAVVRRLCCALVLKDIPMNLDKVVSIKRKVFSRV